MAGRFIQCKYTIIGHVDDDGSYRYFSPRASNLSFASLRAHVCILSSRVWNWFAHEHTETVPCIWFVVEHNCSESHRSKHPDIPDVLPSLFHPLLPWWRRLNEGVSLRVTVPTACMGGRTFSPNSQPEGSLYWGASWEAKRLPFRRGAAMRKARRGDEESMEESGKSSSQTWCNKHTSSILNCVQPFWHNFIVYILYVAPTISTFFRVARGWFIALESNTMHVSQNRGEWGLGPYPKVS